MKKSMLFSRFLASWQLLAAFTLIGGIASAKPKPPIFVSTNSVSNILGVAAYTDRLLVNPWGLVPGYDGFLHVADDGTGVSTVYAPDGLRITSTTGISIPPAALSSGTTGAPTGVVKNDAAFLVVGDTNDFDISANGKTAPAQYLYATEDGAIVGYTDAVDGSNGIKAADESPTAGYTGLALSWVSGTSGTLEHQLYAANFAQGTIDVFDSTFSKLTLSSTSNFTDPNLPAVPDGSPVSAFWSPFNVKGVDFKGVNSEGKHTVLRRIVVAYALNSGTLNDIAGDGIGFVDTFTPEGAFVKHLIPLNDHLNSPWGMAVTHHPLVNLPSPSVLLVGSHGDGRINAYAFTPGIPAIDGMWLGTLVKNKLNDPLAFGGLWTLHFGGKKLTPPEYAVDHAILDEDNKTLFFSAGIVDELCGLVGRIVIP